MVRARRLVAWTMLVGGIVGWPLSALTVAKDEPQFVLGLSFLAIIVEGYNGVQIAEDARGS
jgi:hypothetical protein